MSARTKILAELQRNGYSEIAARRLLTRADQEGLALGRLRDFTAVWTTSDGSDIHATELRCVLCTGLIQGVGPHNLLTLNTAATSHDCQDGGKGAPGFFRPGVTYTEPDGSTDWAFRCDAITTHPEDGERTALGWRRFRGEWAECAYGEDDFEIHLIADAISVSQGDRT
jgi:hypothetical protein